MTTKKRNNNRAELVKKAKAAPTDPLPCPACQAPTFVRPNGTIVSHYTAEHDKCPASETPYIEQKASEGAYIQGVGMAGGAPLLEENLNSGSAPRRARRAATPKPELRNVEIPDQLLHDPQRMIYTLLLALLSQADGEVAFTEDQLDFDDTQYNVVFARTLDNKKLIVNVVSNQSGILRTPGAGQDTVRTWSPQLEKEYFPPPAAEERGATPISREAMLSAGAPMTAQDKFLLAASQEGGAPLVTPPAATQPAGTERLPQSFQFETGDRPETARPVDLGAMAQQATRSVEVEASQAEIAARVEREGR